jgi:hypothetical protein
MRHIASRFCLLVNGVSDLSAGRAPKFTDEDLKVIGSPLDFVGINVYCPIGLRTLCFFCPSSKKKPRLSRLTPACLH